MALTTGAPSTEMKFWQNLKKYQDVGEEISHSVEKRTFHQMFYLTEELVVLGCDKQISNLQKHDIVKALLEAAHPKSFLPMKPLFKVVILHVGARSWLIFDLLDVHVQWMRTNSNIWLENQKYVRFFNINSMICIKCTECMQIS